MSHEVQKSFFEVPAGEVAWHMDKNSQQDATVFREARVVCSNTFRSRDREEGQVFASPIAETTRRGRKVLVLRPNRTRGWSPGDVAAHKNAQLELLQANIDRIQGRQLAVYIQDAIERNQITSVIGVVVLEDAEPTESSRPVTVYAVSGRAVEDPQRRLLQELANGFNLGYSLGYDNGFKDADE